MSTYYDMTVPCDNCPFLREGGIRLRQERAEELAQVDAVFICHKTVDYAAEDEGRPPEKDQERHCAGALILAEKMEAPHQMMRIMERLGLYDADKLMSNAEVADRVFDDAGEMIDANV